MDLRDTAKRGRRPTGLALQSAVHPILQVDLGTLEELPPTRALHAFQTARVIAPSDALVIATSGRLL